MSDTLPGLRAAVLARMVSRAPEKKLGRTQVMKLFYFLQELKELSLGYDFRLFTYGPFDSEVLSDLATACGLGTVCEKTVIYSRGYGYDITPGPHATILSQNLEDASPGEASAVDAIVAEFGGYGAAELELRSTIVFVDRESDQIGEHLTANDLAERVQRVKPHFTKDMILDRIADMTAHALLNSVNRSA